MAWKTLKDGPTKGTIISCNKCGHKAWRFKRNVGPDDLVMPADLERIDMRLPAPEIIKIGDDVPPCQECGGGLIEPI